MASRPLRITASVTSTIALVAAGIAATTGSAAAEPTPDVNTDLCVGTPVWTGGFTDAQPVHGLTTTHGVTPEPFTGTYVSTLKNGAGRGKDILLFRLAGSRITGSDGKVDAGIWAGISGSPVYDADDNLIGSVSYGFSGAASTLAGITPAKDVLTVGGAVTTAPPADIPVPLSISKQVARSTAVAGDSASDYSSIHQLALPKVSVGNSRSATAATKFAGKSRTLDKKLGGVTPKFTPGTQYDGDLDPVTAIVPGGNIATAWSHGDVSFAAVGTVTAVCGDQVFAYGHPDSFDGDRTNETFHAAYADAVQEDDTYGSFQLASIDQSPVGKLTQDRLSGVRGVIGAFPTETTITTNTTVGRDKTSAVTKVSTPEAVSSVLASQLFSDVLDGLDAYANGGEGIVSWTVSYTPKGGAAATYSRSTRISYSSMLAEQLPFEVASDVELLQSGSDQQVTINSVTVNTELKPDYNALRIAKVEYRKSTKTGKKTVTKWVQVKNGGQIKTKRGTTLPLRATLKPASPTSVAKTAVVRIDQAINKYAIGSGITQLSGGQPSNGDDEDFTISFDDDEDELLFYDDAPSTLPEVLAALKAQPRNETVTSNQSYRNLNGTQKVSTRQVRTSAVTSGNFFLQLSYK